MLSTGVEKSLTSTQILVDSIKLENVIQMIIRVSTLIISIIRLNRLFITFYQMVFRVHSATTFPVNLVCE